MAVTRAQRVFLGGVVTTAALAAGLVYAWQYVAPFVLAAFLAAAIDPAVSAIVRLLPVGRGTAVLFVLGVALTTLGGVVFAVAVNVSADLERLLEKLPDYAAAAEAIFDEVVRKKDGWTRRLPPSLADGLRIRPEQWSAAVQAGTKATLGALAALPEGLFVLFVGGLATYFISKDRHSLWRGVLQTVPPEWRGQVVRFRDEVAGGALGLVRAQVALVGITALLSVFCLAAAGVPYAWALGLLAGLLDLAPFLGPSAVFGPAAAAFALQGDGATALLLLGLWTLLVVVRQLIEPRLFGAGVGLHPVTTLLALYVGVRVVGAAGFILGPLLLVVVKALFVVTVGGQGR